MLSASPSGGNESGGGAGGAEEGSSRGYTSLNVPNKYLSESSAVQVKDLLTARAVRTVMVYMTEFHDGACCVGLGTEGRGGVADLVIRRKDCWTGLCLWGWGAKS